MSDHVADERETMVACNVGPDICRVGKKVVPFEIHQLVHSKHLAYSSDTFARGGAVMTVGSVIACTLGNAGKGLFSSVALAAGHAVVLTGDSTVRTNGLPTARHLDIVMMNIPA